MDIIVSKGTSTLSANLGLSLGSSTLRVRPTSFAAMNIEYRLLPIAKLGDTMFTAFTFAAAGQSLATDVASKTTLTMPFGYFGPVIPPWALNCTVWVAGASVTAVAFSLVPIR